jgi:hypothetical protein
MPISPKGESGGDVQEHQLMLVITEVISRESANLVHADGADLA